VDSDSCRTDFISIIIDARHLAFLYSTILDLDLFYIGNGGIM